MATKKMLFLFSFFCSMVSAQKITNLMLVDLNGLTYEVNPAKCTYKPLNKCTGANITSIALIKNIVYFTDGLGLYRYPYDTSGTCEYLGSFSSLGISSLTSSPEGFIYAAAGSQIMSYEPSSGTFRNLGKLPNGWYSSGDLVFKDNQLLLAITDNLLIHIDLVDLNNSKEIISFPKDKKIWGLTSVNKNCFENQMYALNSKLNSTSLLPINFFDNTVGEVTCELPINAADATSISENGLTNIAVFDDVPPICYGEILEPLPTTSINFITGTWAPALNNLATTTYTFTSNLKDCNATYIMTIEVKPNVITPVFAKLPPVCSGNTNIFLPLTSENGISGSWSPVFNNLATTTYTFTPFKGQCASTTTMEVEVVPIKEPIFTQISSICEGEVAVNLPIISNNGITGSWFPAFNSSETTTYTFIPAANECATTQTMTVVVNSYPKITFQDKYVCFDPITNNPINNILLETNFLASENTFKWYYNNSLLLNEKSEILKINAIGQYYVEAQNSVTNCTTRSNVVSIGKKNVITNFEIDVFDEFTEYASVQIKTNEPDLFFSLDGSQNQTETIFKNVSYGEHIIAITDGCTNFKETILVNGYPKFFTPNGDGFNDFWNIYKFDVKDIFSVSIFDRYGKLLHTASSINDTWNGKFNNVDLPATDYWFTVNYKNKKAFKSHFSLKR